MAKQTSSPLLDNLTCSLCLDIFTEPKLLPCHHTFCLKCLQDLAKRHSGKFPCPQCRTNVDVPAEGVETFQTNFYLLPADLDKARNNSVCLVHAQMDLDFFCVDCKQIVCVKCVKTQHKQHTTTDLPVVINEAKDQLAEDKKRLNEVVSYIIAQVDSDKEELNAIHVKKAALETAINNRHDTVVAMADKFRDDQLTSLNATCEEIQIEMTKQIEVEQNNLYQLCQQVEDVISSGKTTQLLNVAKEMKEGIERKSVTRPVLNFNQTDEIFQQNLQKILTATTDKVILDFTAPEVSVNEQFRCGEEKDISVFSLCPNSSDEVWVSYAICGGQEDSTRKCFNHNGQFLRLENRKLYSGKASYMEDVKGNGLLLSYTDHKWVRTFIKSPSELFITLRFNISERKGYVKLETVMSRDPLTTEQTTLFTISLPGPHRAFDVDGTQQLFVVLEEARDPGMKRRVHLYQRDQEQAVATYTPPSPLCQPSDVCFFTLGGQELLMVADEGTDTIHVVLVQRTTLTFLRYLSPGCPLLVQPTALNRDHEGRLWVACRGGVILTITPLVKM